MNGRAEDYFTGVRKTGGDALHYYRKTRRVGRSCTKGRGSIGLDGRVPRDNP